MKLKFCLILIFAACIAVSGSLAGCGKAGDSKKLAQVTAYIEKGIDLKAPLRLDMECGNGDIDVYSWTNKELAFEITDTIIGDEKPENLGKRLKDFEIKAEEDNGVIRVNTGYRGGGRNISASMNMKVYIPKKPVSIKITKKGGRLRFLDYLECGLDIAGDSVDIELNSFEGYLRGRLGTGSLHISEGKLLNGSNFSTGRGNIHIRSDFSEGGRYSFKTSSGLIELSTPEKLKVMFETTEPIEPDSIKPGDNPAIIRLECGFGRIAASKY